MKAVENGFSVAFFRFDDLLAALKRDADVPPQRLRGKKYNSVALLIVDEFGFRRSHAPRRATSFAWSATATSAAPR